MARFLVLWRMNPAALPLMPKDPSESLKLHERWYAGIADSIKKGEIEEFGFFLDTSAGGASGYAISKGEATDILRAAWMQLPYTLFEVHEMIPFEKGKEITMALVKAMIQAVKK